MRLAGQEYAAGTVAGLTLLGQTSTDAMVVSLASASYDVTAPEASQYLSIKPARSEKGWIQGVWSVGGHEDLNIPP